MPQPDRSIRPLRVGIIGAGWVARARHVPAYRRQPGVEIVGVCDRTLASARRLAGDARARLATTSLDELLEAQLDLVSICTPPFAHPEPAIRALGAGVNVLLEKPMAASLVEAAEIAAAAERNPAQLCVSHNFLFSHSMRRLRREIETGRAGAIHQVVAFQSSSPRRRLPSWYRALPGGLFFDESPHLLYLMTSLLGEMHLEAATAAFDSPEGPPQIRSLQVAFSSPVAPASLTMSFDAPVSEWHLMVICERRVLLVDLFRDISIVLPGDGSHTARDILATSLRTGWEHVRGFARSGGALLRGRQDWGHGLLIHQMVESVRTGAPPPVPLADSLRVAKVTDDILRSIGLR